MPLTAAYLGPLLNQVAREYLGGLMALTCDGFAEWISSFVTAVTALPGLPASWGSELAALKIEVEWDGSAPGALLASACCALLREIAELGADEYDFTEFITSLREAGFVRVTP